MKTTIRALIINWNGSRDTLELLHSLATEQSETIGLHAVVVDNGSRDDERSTLASGVKELDPHISVSVIWNTDNRGVPAAYNQAILADGPIPDAYLRLDNDVVILPGAIALLFSRLQSWRSKGVRIVGGNIRYYQDPDKNNGGAIRLRLVVGRNPMSFPLEDTLCDGILGCVMMLDRELVKCTSPRVFDESLFLFGDESELSLRAREMNWGTLYVATPIALHKSGTSTKKVPKLSRLLSTRNSVYLALKYVRPPVLRFPVALRLMVEFTLRLIRLDIISCRAIFQGAMGWARGKASRGRP